MAGSDGSGSSSRGSDRRAGHGPAERRLPGPPLRRRSLLVLGKAGGRGVDTSGLWGAARCPLAVSPVLTGYRPRAPGGGGGRHPAPEAACGRKHLPTARALCDDRLSGNERFPCEASTHYSVQSQPKRSPKRRGRAVAHSLSPKEATGSTAETYNGAKCCRHRRESCVHRRHL